MNELQVKKLQDQFPIMMKDQWPECNDGWFSLLHELCVNLQKMKLDSSLTFAQIKEKFAVLRIYYDINGDNPEFPSDVVDSLIQETERKSESVCEVCGEPGTIDNSRWWKKTLCEAHKASRAESA